MQVREIWRYPVKSLRGEAIAGAVLGVNGIPGDRQIVVVSSKRRRILTSRTHPRLLGLQGSLNADGTATINGEEWQSGKARKMVEEAAGEAVELVSHPGPERFDVLPLLVATDGALDEMGVDYRRFRSNIIIGGVWGREERNWEGRRLRIGDAEIGAAQLRGRCVMTTYDPDTLQQDMNVLRRIVDEFDGTMALDCSVIVPGKIQAGDLVELLEERQEK